MSVLDICVCVCVCVWDPQGADLFPKGPYASSYQFEGLASLRGSHRRGGPSRVALRHHLTPMTLVFRVGASLPPRLMHEVNRHRHSDVAAQTHC